MEKKILLCSTVCIGLIGAEPAFAAKKNSQSPKKPNIVFILADDLGYGDLSCYGQEKFDTPNIDKLAREGKRFTQCYSGSTVSAPSRSCLLTGTHGGNTPIRGNMELEPEGQFPLPANSATIFKDFKKAGYTTAVFGKWGLGFVGSEGDPNNQGVDLFYGYNCQRLAHSYYPTHLWENDKRIEFADNRPGTEYGKGTYAPDLIHNRALAFLEHQVKNGDEPFFMWYPTVLPHAELIVPEDSIIKKFRGIYPEKPYKGTEPGNAAFLTGGYCSQFHPRATFAAMVYRLDVHVGQIVSKLKELGVYENTIIIFTSDNGPHREGGADPEFFNSNGIWRGHKRDLYEGGIRVPMIISWPGRIESNTESNLMCSFGDFMPTFREVLGVGNRGEKLTGISLLPLLENRKGQKEHEYLYFEFQEMNGRQALRSGAWKLVHLNIRSDNPSYELYNLSSDPSERYDRSTEFPDKVNELKEMMAKLRTPNPDFPVLKGERKR